MDIYDKIDELLSKNKISRRKLAIDLGIPPSTLQSMMARKSGLSTELLKQIADKFNLQVQYFYETEKIIIPGRLKIIYVDDPDKDHVAVDIEAADKEALEYGINIINGNQSYDEETILGIKVNALFNCLNIENKRIIVNQCEKLATEQE